MRKSFLCTLFAVLGLMTFISCDNTETYGEKKDKARNAIEEFIRDSAINVISEDVFHAQQDSTDVKTNQYVYMNSTGVYMQIVRKGCGEQLEENKAVNLLCKYTEYNILDKFIQTRNDNVNSYDKMTVTRTGTSFEAYFASGIMQSTYSSTYVPSGWLVPLNYIKVGRAVNPGDEIALVKLIVPHTQGQANASSNVYPCFYVISFQRKK